MTTRKSVYLAFLIATGILLQLLESFVPIAGFVPGFKIGFANIVSLFALYAYGQREMWIVGMGRILLSSFLQGTFLSIPFWLSCSGGMLAMLMMALWKKSDWFSIYGISIIGSAFHVVGQVISITWIYQQYFMQIFLPILLAMSIVSGLCIAYFTTKLLQNMRKGEIL